MALIFGKYGPGRSEFIQGTPDDDVIDPLGGDDTIDGGRGYDVVLVHARSTEFKISTVNGVTYLDTTSGASTGKGVTLKNVEELRFDDKTISLVVNDRVINTPFADFSDGGPGTDTFVYKGNRSDYKLSANWLAATVSVDRIDRSESSDFLTNFERLEFAGGSRVALDLGVNESGGQAVLLIGAVLGKSLLPAKAELMGQVIGLFDQGYTMQQLAGAILRLPIWAGVLTATNSSDDIARYLLKTVNKADPTADALRTASAALAAESPQAQGTWLAQLAASAANQTQVDLVGLKAQGFDYSVTGG